MMDIERRKITDDPALLRMLGHIFIETMITRHLVVDLLEKQLGSDVTQVRMDDAYDAANKAFTDWLQSIEQDQHGDLSTQVAQLRYEVEGLMQHQQSRSERQS